MDTIEEQLIDLQTRILFQDDTIQALNDVLGQQQKEIDGLTRMVKIINGQLKQMAPDSGMPMGDEPPPPHY